MSMSAPDTNNVTDVVTSGSAVETVPGAQEGTTAEPKFTAEQVETKCPERLRDIGKLIAARLEKIDKQIEQAENHSISVNQLITQAKALCDEGGFNAFREKFFPNLGKSRVYELLAIGTSKKSVEEVKARTRARVAKYRANKAASSVSVTVTDNSELEMPGVPTKGCEPEQMPEPAKPRSAVAPGDEALRAFTVQVLELSHLYQLEQVDGFSPSLIGAIGKLKGYFARICLVLHVIRTHDPLIPSRCPAHFVSATAFSGLDPSECLSAGISINAEISCETAEAAKKLLFEFLLPHMIGLYDVVVNGGQEREKLQSIANFILASDKDRLRPSDFTAGVRTLRGEPEQKIRDWVGRFSSMDWLSPEETKAGVPAKAWQVAPGLRDHFIERRMQAQAARAEMHAILKAGGSSRSR
jgi:hypothetical protein